MEALLQRVSDQVQGLERQLAATADTVDILASGLGRVQGRLDSVEGKLDRLEAGQSKLEAQGAKQKASLAEQKASLAEQKASLEGKLAAQSASLVHVVAFAQEERARRDDQARQQRVFIHIVFIAANAGFEEDFKVCFGLNRAMWNDERLWITIVKKQYKYTRRELKEKGKEGEPDEYRNVERKEPLLHRACREGRESSVRRLLRLGASLRATSELGDRALAVASMQGRKGVVSVLLTAGADVRHVRSSDGFAALHWAARKGFPECLKLLLAAGADVDQVTNIDATALIVAAAFSRPECMEVLLAAGSDVDHAAIDGDSALNLAAEDGLTEVVKMLLAAGADANRANKKDNWTALLFAACKGHPEIVRLLLASGAQVDHASNDNWTALLWAAQEGHIECVRLLLAAGADANHTANNGATALRLAKYKKHEEIAALLEAHIAEAAEQARLAALVAKAIASKAAGSPGERQAKGGCGSSNENDKSHTNSNKTEALGSTAGDGGTSLAIPVQRPDFVPGQPWHGLGAVLQMQQEHELWQQQNNIGRSGGPTRLPRNTHVLGVDWVGLPAIQERILAYENSQVQVPQRPHPVPSIFVGSNSSLLAYSSAPSAAATATSILGVAPAGAPATATRAKVARAPSELEAAATRAAEAADAAAAAAAAAALSARGPVAKPYVVTLAPSLHRPRTVVQPDTEADAFFKSMMHLACEDA